MSKKKKVRRIPVRVKPTEQTAPQEQPRRERPLMREQDRYRVAVEDWTGDLMWGSREFAAKIWQENLKMWRKLLNGELDTEAMYQEELERMMQANKSLVSAYVRDRKEKGLPIDPKMIEALQMTPEQVRTDWDEKMERAWQLAEENLGASED